jgi:hypothetical protein
MTAITFRYLDMAGKLCDADALSLFVPAPMSARPDLRRFIEAASRILPWAADTLKAGVLPPMPNPLPEQKDWVKVREIIRLWGKMLLARPFNIAEAELWAPVRKKSEKAPD